MSTWSELLHTVQTSGLYPDSKTFVDKRLKFSKDEILEKFHSLNKDPTSLKSFIDTNFEDEGDFIKCVPEGYKESPTFLDGIEDEKYREFAKYLNGQWKELTRKIHPDIQSSSDGSSLLYVPEPFVVPGSRFREFYYWDTYWTVQGMLVCELYSAVKSMLVNFIYLVNRYGFVPNGGRKYYLNRSQPPLLIPCVASYIDTTGDLSFLSENITALEKEYEFWMRKRCVKVNVDSEEIEYFQYRVDTDVPRDESYKEDLQLAETQVPEKRAALYADFASAAESGWDFSTRWFDLDKPSSLSSISTRDVIPVDLNALLCWNTRLLMELYKKLGDSKKVSYYKEKYAIRQRQLEKLFWDEEKGAWFDYHLTSGKRDTRFFASMIVPVFTGCHGNTVDECEYKIERILSYLSRELPLLESYKCGIPTSLTDSNEQWDYPNAWPPLQHMWVHAFQQSDNKDAQKFAQNLGDKWVRTNWRSWSENHHMYEKYNAVTGEAGHGGEYEVQVGFGWTNGVILDLLTLYPGLTSKEL